MLLWSGAPSIPSHCHKQTFINKSLTRSTRSRVISCNYHNASASASLRVGLIGSAAMVMMIMFSASAATPPPDEETMANIPQNLSGECLLAKDCKKARIQHPKSRKAESCTVKCVTTCIRGGAGSPGEGPLNARGPIVVFKPGFRSRQYCLVECSDICNLMKENDD